MKKSKEQKNEDQLKIRYKIDSIDIAMVEMEETVKDIKISIIRMRSILDAHINRKFTEIRVMEKDGKWGDYSGIFYVNDEDEESMVLKKAKNHFEKYFENGSHHSNKKLGLFLTKGRIKKLVEEIKTDVR